MLFLVAVSDISCVMANTTQHFWKYSYFKTALQPNINASFAKTLFSRKFKKIKNTRICALNRKNTLGDGILLKRPDVFKITVERKFTVFLKN